MKSSKTKKPKTSSLLSKIQAYKALLSSNNNNISNLTSIPNTLPGLLCEYINYLHSINVTSSSNSTNNLDEVLETKHELYDIFSFIINHPQRKDSIKSDLIEFITSKIDILSKVYIDMLDLSGYPSFSEETENINVLLLDFLYSNYEIFMEEYKIENAKQLVIKVIENILFSNESIISNGILGMIINTYLYNKYFYEEFDLRVNEYFSSEWSDSHLVRFNNIMNFLFHIPESVFSKKEFTDYDNLYSGYEGNDLLYNKGNNVNKLIHQSKDSFQKGIIYITSVITNHFSSNTMSFLNINPHVHLLKKLPKLFNLCNDPLLLSEYLLKIYNKEKIDVEIKILSLNCLFKLIINHNFIFEDYYSFLYQSLFIENVLSGKHAKKLFKILHSSLVISTVSKNVVCSFIKKISRLMLKSDSEMVLRSMKLIVDLFHCHNKTLILLYRKNLNEEREIVENKENDSLINNQKYSQILVNSQPNVVDKNLLLCRKRKGESDEKKQKKRLLKKINEEEIDLAYEPSKSYGKYDCFIENEKDPFRTKADRSSLWELYTLKSHFNYKIVEVANKFTRKFIKKDVNVDDILNIKHEKDVLYCLTEKNRFYVNYDYSISNELNNMDDYMEKVKLLGDKINIFK